MSDLHVTEKGRRMEEYSPTQTMNSFKFENSKVSQGNSNFEFVAKTQFLQEIL